MSAGAPADPTVLPRALAGAPRRHRMPPLPVDIDGARAANMDTGVAFAIEAARRGRADARVRTLFLEGTAALVREAMAPGRGDPGFQALVLRAQEPEVEAYVQLAAQEAADRRALRSAVDAIAHPGKLRALAPGAERDALARLHALSGEDDWRALGEASAQVPGAQAIASHAALARLQRGAALRALASVQRYEALGALRGPLAGSDAAAAQGRASARAGSDAEAATLDAFHAIASLLPGHRAVRGLRTPRGFPGAANGAKAEWDAAIVQGEDLVLLAEVKASPAAVSSDFTRLLRGLQALAQASAEQSYAFPSADGEVRISGASLRALQPQEDALPPHVIYCCSAPPEPEVPMLGAAPKGVLLTEPACIAFAAQLARGNDPGIETLAPLWDALTTAPRLRPALHQYPVALQAREAMLHPRDLLDAVTRAIGAT